MLGTALTMSATDSLEGGRIIGTNRLVTTFVAILGKQYRQRKFDGLEKWQFHCGICHLYARLGVNGPISDKVPT